MNTKLTLRLDDSLIESAKRYSAQTGKSVSRIVADFFTMIKNEQLVAEELLPATMALKGLLKGKPVSQADYQKHLEEKHL